MTESTERRYTLDEAKAELARRAMTPTPEVEYVSVTVCLVDGTTKMVTMAKPRTVTVSTDYAEQDPNAKGVTVTEKVVIEIEWPTSVEGTVTYV